MLPCEVYQLLFDSVKHLDQDPIVEIGTAHGAATVAMGLGSKHFQTNHQIYTVDMFGGRFSSRRAFGEPDQNLQIVKENLKRAGIKSAVHVFKGSSEEFAKSAECPTSISMLMLDADGRIDRDFILFYKKLKPGGLIVVDDADRGIYLSLNCDKEIYIDLKHRITSLMLDNLYKAGYIDDLKMVSNTLFCRATGKDLELTSFQELALGAYRELVFSHVDGNWEDLAYLNQFSGRARKALDFYNKCGRLLKPINRMRRALTKILVK